ncbi:hypothetical protein IWQ61_006001 [Dispira simplex]|nr:hypothetical protein IWQ61_006001 [Dispira simplex]
MLPSLSNVLRRASRGDQGEQCPSTAPPTHLPQVLSPWEDATLVQHPSKSASAGSPLYSPDYPSRPTPLSRYEENDCITTPSTMPPYEEALRHTRTADCDLSWCYPTESGPSEVLSMADLGLPFRHYLPQTFASLPPVRPFSQPPKKRQVEEMTFIPAGKGVDVSSHNVDSERRLSNPSQSLLQQMISRPHRSTLEEGPEPIPSGNSPTVAHTSMSPEPFGSDRSPTSPIAGTKDRESSRRMRNAEASARCRKKKREKEREEQMRNQKVRAHMESIWSKVTLYESRSAEEALLQLRAKQANPEDIMAKLVIKVENIIDDNRYLKRRVAELQAILDSSMPDSHQ